MHIERNINKTNSINYNKQSKRSGTESVNIVPKK